MNIDKISKGFADAIWASSYADAAQFLKDEGYVKSVPWSGGGRIEDYAPAAPASIVARVKKLLSKVPLASLEKELNLSFADKYDAPDSAEEFGWQLGLSWLGHGVVGSAASVRISRILRGGEMAVRIAVRRDRSLGRATLEYTSLPA